MARRVVDTNIVSYLWKAHSLAKEYQPHLRGCQIFVSFMTVAELREGALLANWQSRRLKDLMRFASQYHMINSTARLAKRWAAIRFERRNQPISVPDAWIAATALTLDCELVTHNPRDFAGITGLEIITEAVP